MSKPTQEDIKAMAAFLANYKVPPLKDGSYRVRLADGKEIVVYPPKSNA